ncbi:hypothetical protein BVY91_004447 [Salmonella enterica subsp. enterica serovar Poano]|nr:hypothetical protein [Salmonella enterica]EDT9930237.1 hypothetical protein [Salmonella enterica subsp. enterica serovar Poano]EDW0488488.1 hypothetical protein [Salmonella enterica subsp. enterica serovar Poano]EEJ5270736.1 hypothetical protein [Salmonella enterica subsp. enterica serovar Poano]
MLSDEGPLIGKQRTGTAVTLTARATAFCPLAASKGKECDGQPPQYV